MNITRTPSSPMTTASAPTAWEPFRMLRDLVRMDPFGDWTSSPLVNVDRSFMPCFEVKENREAYTLRADMPGVKESDVEISLSGNQLTIAGKREAERKEDKETYYLYERSYGSFTRAFTLPSGVDEAKVNASLKDGVLTVMLPKRPEAQPKKIALHK